MVTTWTTRRNGFTIVELLVVIAVIGILATISIVAYSGVQARARDSLRKDDLATIKKAMLLYHMDHGDYIEAGSGCGYNGDGQGWFNYSGGSYPASIASCLTSGRYTDKDMIDPTGGKTSTPTAGFTYMKYNCGTGDAEKVYVYAKLESLPQSSTATDGTCASTLDTSYGMNYYVEVH